MSDHTPGPWRIAGMEESSLATVFIFDDADQFIAEVSGPLRGNHDARLIAAAPDMFDDLLVIKAIATEPHHEDALRAIRDIAGNAIAKAKGGRDE